MAIARAFLKFTVFCLGLVMSSAWAEGGHISEMSGEVTVAVGQSVPHSAAINTPLLSNMTINTAEKSHAVLKFDDGQMVTLRANSSFHISEYRYVPKHEAQSSIVFSMLQGGMRFVTGLIGKHNRAAFRLTTPTATIGIRGTEVMIVTINGTTYMQVVSGSISVTNAAGTVVFSAGETIAVTSASSLASAIPASALPTGAFANIPVTSIGGAATGGAAGAAGSTTAVGTGVASSTMLIGAGVAAIAAIATSGSTTSHHFATTHHP